MYPVGKMPFSKAGVSIKKSGESAAVNHLFDHLFFFMLRDIPMINLGGFHPEPWGEDLQFDDCAYFFRWVETTNLYYLWVSPTIGVPQNGWFIMENPMNKWMIGGVPLFLKNHQPDNLHSPVFPSNGFIPQEDRIHPWSNFEETLEDVEESFRVSRLMTGILIIGI